MRHTRIGLVAAALVPACEPIGTCDFHCDTSTLDVRTEDFERLCDGAPCGATIAGSTAVVPSLLPGDHAFALDPGATITWSWRLRGTGATNELGAAVRCDDGGSLHFSGTGGATGTTIGTDTGATADWRRHVWSLGDGGAGVLGGATSSGMFDASLWFTNTGTARCAIDIVRFASLQRFCGGGLCPFSTSCSGGCVDVQSDPSNCGACGVACAAGVQCRAGRCADAIDCATACTGRCDIPNPCGTGYCSRCPEGQQCSFFHTCVGGPPIDAGPSIDVPAPPPPVVAGRRCVSDGECASTSPALACTETPGGRVCSHATGCAQGSVAVEEAECGGVGSTCLVYGTSGAGPRGLCTRACAESAPVGSARACPVGSVCTTNWPERTAGSVERPGCLPFCATDADCANAASGEPGTAHCNTHLGTCEQTPRIGSTVADGLPCDPMNVATTGVDPCAGRCMVLDATRPTEGLCGSYVDRAQTEGCSVPSMTPLFVDLANLGACVFRDCAKNADCPMGLRCVYPELSGVPQTDGPARCSYATAAQPVGIVAVDGGIPMDAASRDP